MFHLRYTGLLASHSSLYMAWLKHVHLTAIDVSVVASVKTDIIRTDNDFTVYLHNLDLYSYSTDSELSFASEKNHVFVSD